MYSKLFPTRYLSSFFEISIIEVSKKISVAVFAKVFAASSAPFNPIDVPPDATACHECAAVPGTQVAVLNPAVGTFQLTSPTSVEP